MRKVLSRPLGLCVLLVAALLFWPLAPVRAADAPAPVLVGMTAEFGLKDSVSAQAVEMGIRIAMEEINATGGVLGGRPLRLVTRDDRSVPARAKDNLREFAETPDMVAVFGARFSPVLLELVPLAHELEMILLDPWASADQITDHEFTPSWTFRLSLKDSFAMPTMLGYAQAKGFKRLGLLLPNNGWGRSNERVAERYFASHPEPALVRTRWYNWGDTSLLQQYQDILSAKADAVVLVANDREAVILLNEVLALPPADQLPFISHWGVTGGKFFESVRDGLAELDFAVVQTFSFFRAEPSIRDRFMRLANKLQPLNSYEEIPAPVGVGHAYDLTHLLARAVDKAGNTNRADIRTALEELGPYAGLTGFFERPFTPDNHDALGQEAVFMVKYREDGVLVPIAMPAAKHGE
jgi:branched-chain amino acid transport system substrate-binding protein